MTALLVLAIGLDSATFLVIGQHNEANPIVLALGPGLALAIRWSAVGLLLATARYLRRRRLVLGGLAWYGIVGTFSNVLVMVR